MDQFASPGSFIYVTHIIFGTFAFFTGPWQFITLIRERHLAFHRLLGRVYLVCVLIAGTTGFAISFNTPLPWAAAGTALQSIFWLGFSGLAYDRIRRKNIKSHRRFMIRSYALVLAAPFIRLGIIFLETLTPVSYMDNFDVTYPLMVWASFLPLLAAEAYIRRPDLP